MESHLIDAVARIEQAKAAIVRAYRDAGPVESIVLERILDDCANLRESIRALTTAVAAVEAAKYAT